MSFIAVDNKIHLVDFIWLCSVFFQGYSFALVDVNEYCLYDYFARFYV